MAKKLSNHRQLGGQKKGGPLKQVMQRAAEKTINSRFIVTCILEDMPQEMQAAYYNCEAEKAVENFDPTTINRTPEEWKAFCINCATFEGMVVTIYRLGGDITVGETILTVGDSRYLIRAEEYRSLAHLTPPTLQRLLYLARVPNFK